MNSIPLELISVYKSSIAELYIGTFNGMLTTLSYTATGFEQLQFTNMIIQQDLRYQFAYYDSVTGNRAPATQMDAEAALMTGGNAAEGPGKYFNESQLQTEPNKAYFWSGLGEDGASIASSIARSNGGVTLETTIESQGIDLPKFDFNNPASIEAWRNASATYANQASGEVRAIIGSGMRPNSIWNTIELPALIANPNVTKIITINPATMVETIIFTRG